MEIDSSFPTGPEFQELLPGCPACGKRLWELKHKPSPGKAELVLVFICGMEVVWIDDDGCPPPNWICLGGCAETCQGYFPEPDGD